MNRIDIDSLPWHRSGGRNSFQHANIDEFFFTSRLVKCNTDGRYALPSTGVAEKISSVQIEGGAIGIGFGGEFDIWCDVGAFIDGDLLGVIAQQSIKDVRYRRVQAGSFTQSQESYPSETCVIPEVDFRVGVNYTYACGCWKVVGELGYEVDYFWHGSVLPDFTNFQTPQNPRDFVPLCEDLGFSGLFFGARLIF